MFIIGDRSKTPLMRIIRLDEKKYMMNSWGFVRLYEPYKVPIPKARKKPLKGLRRPVPPAKTEDAYL